MHQFRQCAIILLLTTVLSGCGFQLRGYGENNALPDFLLNLELNSPDPGNGTLRQLRNKLRSQVTLLDEASQETPSLSLSSESVQERIISLNSNARAGEYELSLSTTIHLQLNGDSLLGPEHLELSKVYLADPNNAVAKTEEAEQILEEMQSDLASQIIQRLQNISID